MIMKPAQHGTEKEPVSNKDHCSTLTIMDNPLTAIQLAQRRKESKSPKRIFWFQVFLKHSYSVLSRHRWSCQGNSPVNWGPCKPQHKSDSCCRNATFPVVLSISVLTLKARGSGLLSDRWWLLFSEDTSSGLLLVIICQYTSQYAQQFGAQLPWTELDSTVGRCEAPR